MKAILLPGKGFCDICRQGTKDLGLTYAASDKPSVLEGYADSDWASDKDTRRSVTAYVFMFGGGSGY